MKRAILLFLTSTAIILVLKGLIIFVPWLELLSLLPFSNTLLILAANYLANLHFKVSVKAFITVVVLQVILQYVVSVLALVIMFGSSSWP